MGWYWMCAVTTYYHIINILCASLLWHIHMCVILYTRCKYPTEDGFIENESNRKNGRRKQSEIVRASVCVKGICTCIKHQFTSATGFFTSYWIHSTDWLVCVSVGVCASAPKHLFQFHREHIHAKWRKQTVIETICESLALAHTRTNHHKHHVNKDTSH